VISKSSISMRKTSVGTTFLSVPRGKLVSQRRRNQEGWGGMLT